MFNSPQAEFDIRSRTRWLAEALAASSNLPIDFPTVIGQIQAEAASVPPEADHLTYFALERLSQKVGLPLAKFERPGQTIVPASLVWVAPNIQANDADARELAKAALVVAGPDWTGLIQQARQKPRRPSP